MFYLVNRGRTERSGEWLRYVEDSGDSAVYSLALSKNPQAISYLKDRVAEDRYRHFDALVALAMIGDGGAMEELRKKVKESLYQSRDAIRQLAYFAYTDQRKQVIGLVKSMQKTLRKDNRAYVSAVAVRAQLGDATAIPELISLLSSPDESIREAAVYDVGENWGQTVSISAPHLIVADQALLDAMDEAFDSEADDDNREDIGEAAMNIRAKLRAQ